jgi:NDP-sugar pyrophosphorylase family protein
MSVALGAILVVEPESGRAFENVGSPECSQNIERTDFLASGPLTCVEILGRSVIERSIERFVKADVETVSVQVQAGAVDRLPTFRTAFGNVDIRIADDVWTGVVKALQQFSEDGIDYAFVCRASAYMEVDLVDLFQFHRQTRQAVTRASDNEGFLDLWISCCGESAQAMFADPETTPRKGKDGGWPVTYFVKEYVNRLVHPRDLRRLVADAFRRRCEVIPVGQEIRPGVWVDEGAQIDRRARIVAPAYLGCGSAIKEDTLITRFSNIESFSFVDYGTVIEDSSILTNTYVGIWLDMCHAVVEGNQLLNLAHNVSLEIADPSLIRVNRAIKKEAKGNFAMTGCA